MADVTVKKHYTCPWCGNEFDQTVSYSAGNMNINTKMPGKRAACSSQVHCVKCGNNMPTWKKIDLGDGKSIKIRS